MTIITGIDVAKYQPVSPDPATTVPNIQFYIAKATQGTTPDPTYAAHVVHARQANIPVVGAYHFGTNSDPAAQLAAFLKTAGKVELYALDVEGVNGMTSVQAKQFIAGLKSAGHKAVMYHSLSGFPNYGQDLNWVAYYSKLPPPIHWDFWQYGSATTNVDGDRYNGSTAAMLTALGLSSASYLMAYIRLWVPLYNSLGHDTGQIVHGGGTRLKIGPLTRLSNGLHYYRILEGTFTNLYLHSGDPRFVVYKVPA